MYLLKEEITCFTEVFLVGVANSQLVEVSTRGIVKQVVPTEGGNGPMKSPARLKGWSPLEQKPPGPFPVFGLGA